MAEKVEKERLDVLLVQQGLANSRELAKAYIMAGNVYVDGQKEDKAGTKVAVTAKLEVKGNQMKYVSRGGYKLEKAMDVFGIRLNVTHEQVPDEGDFASIDVSFISLTKVLPAVLGVLGEKGQLVCLIKPQFEAGREKVGKKGVVRDSSVHREVIEMIVEYVRTQSLGILGLDFSPIKGPEGNIEYLIYLDKSRSGMHEDEAQARVDTVVAQSHKSLSGER